MLPGGVSGMALRTAHGDVRERTASARRAGSPTRRSPKLDPGTSSGDRPVGVLGQPVGGLLPSTPGSPSTRVRRRQPAGERRGCGADHADAGRVRRPAWCACGQRGDGRRWSAALGRARPHRRLDQPGQPEHQRQPDDRVELVHVAQRRQRRRRAAVCSGVGEPALRRRRGVPSSPAAARAAGRAPGTAGAGCGACISPTRPSISTTPLFRTR